MRLALVLRVGPCVLASLPALALGDPVEPAFAASLESAARESLATLAQRTPASDRWHDKHSLLNVYEELAHERAPSPADLDEAARRIESLLGERSSDPESAWRLEQLLARLAAARGRPEEELSRVLRAIDAFPERPGRAHAKTSQLPHLVNEAASATWALHGVDAAEDFFVSYLQDHPNRLQPWWPWWRPRFDAEGHRSRYEALVRRAWGRSWGEELVRRVTETWDFVAGRSLEELPHRDKNSFSHEASDLRVELEPSPEELREAEAAVRAWAREDDPHLRWRTRHLLSALAWSAGDCERGWALALEALDACPEESYAKPSAQSFFQHLLNDAAEKTWETRGLRAAEDLAVETMRSDPRLVYFHDPPWRDRYGRQADAAAMGAFESRLLEALRAKAAARPALVAQLELTRRSLEERAPRTAGGDTAKSFFLHGARGGPAPEKGFGLVVVLPGGDGGPGFRDFVSQLRQVFGEGWLAAQLVAHPWTEDQVIVWPTRSNPVPGMKFSTEKVVDAVVDEVRSLHPIDEDRVVLLGWSSGGPPVQAAMLAPRSRYRRAIVLMSVFKPDTLPPLTGARDQAWCLVHSPQDAVCPYAMAETAERALAAAGARVSLLTYEGGHGWGGDALAKLEAARSWLFATN